MLSSKIRRELDHRWLLGHNKNDCFHNCSEQALHFVQIHISRGANLNLHLSDPWRCTQTLGGVGFNIFISHTQQPALHALPRQLAFHDGRLAPNSKCSIIFLDFPEHAKPGQRSFAIAGLRVQRIDHYTTGPGAKYHIQQYPEEPLTSGVSRSIGHAA
jgi:hypothetical protein